MTLDDPSVRALARRDPALFLQSYPAPVFIDEIQYAPQLLPFIKMAVDAEPDRMGMFWLTGSQPFRLMRGVSESLAGRVALLPIGGISQSEARGMAPSELRLDMRPAGEQVKLGVNAIFDQIFRGSYPAVVSGRVRDVEAFYRSYVATYLERDIRDLAQVADEGKFLDFLKVAAARTAQLVNLSNMAQDVGISVPTAKAWLSLLEASGIVFLLHPFARNMTARVVKTPKLYFLDTGLVCYLTGWVSGETAQKGAMAGALLETFVIDEIVKKYWNNGKEPRLSFYRDRTGTEIDLLIEQAMTLHPVEIKKTAMPGDYDLRNFAKVEKMGITLGTGMVICFVDAACPISRTTMAVPVAEL